MIMIIMMVVEERPDQTHISKEQYVLKYEFHFLFGDSSRNRLLELSP